MQSPQLSCINFTTDQVNYTEGPSATLSAVSNASHDRVTRQTCTRKRL